MSLATLFLSTGHYEKITIILHPTSQSTNDPVGLEDANFWRWAAFRGEAGGIILWMFLSRYESMHALDLPEPIRGASTPGRKLPSQTRDHNIL